MKIVVIFSAVFCMTACGKSADDQKASHRKHHQAAMKKTKTYYSYAKARAGKWFKATSLAECRTHNDCKMLGKCSFVEGRCQAETDLDCSESFGCKEFTTKGKATGYCKADKGQCIEPPR